MTSLYLGWQYAAPAPDPGPPPRPPVPPAWERPPGEWLAAQRREERLIARPARLAAGLAAGLAALLAIVAAARLVPLAAAAAGIAACAAAAALGGYSVWRGQRALGRGAAAELLRAARLREDLQASARRAQAEYARSAARWQEQRSAFARQKRWYAVPVPEGTGRVDVAGGTLAGWSAMLTMAAAYRLAAGGEVTVVDLSGGAVAADLAGLCAATGAAAGAATGAATGAAVPAVWVLPHDLPRLDLAASLAPADLADVLALTASVAEEHSSARDLAVDTAILDRVIEVLGRDGGDGPQVRRVTAALRVLAQVGDPRADLAAGLLTDREAAALSVLFGQGVTDRVVLDRALGMEAQLRRLAAVGTSPARLPRGRLRVVAVDRRASPQAATVLGSFVVTSLTHLIAQAPAAGGPASWRHALFLLGAERLRGDVLDRFTDACEASGSGLVLAYRSMPAHVRQRIGRGNAAVAFMRLGNAEDAKSASEQIGMTHRFVVSQLTETVGTSVTDTLGQSYTSTVGDSGSVAASASSNESRSTGTGRSSPSAGVLPLRGGGSRSAQAGDSRGTSQSASITTGISASSAWGLSTSRAAGDSESLARSLQRSREFTVEPAELQRLPVTAMIVSYGAGPGRRVLLADANPAIGALPVATLTPLDGPAAGMPPAGRLAGDSGQEPARSLPELTAPSPAGRRTAPAAGREADSIRPRWTTTPGSSLGCPCGPGSRPRSAARPLPSPASPGRATGPSSAASSACAWSPTCCPC